MDPVIIAAFITAGSSIIVAILTALNIRSSRRTEKSARKTAAFSHQTRENTNHITHELVAAREELARLAGLAEGKKIGRAQGVEDERTREENEQ